MCFLSSKNDGVLPWKVINFSLKIEKTVRKIDDQFQKMDAYSKKTYWKHKYKYVLYIYKYIHLHTHIYAYVFLFLLLYARAHARVDKQTNTHKKNVYTREISSSGCFRFQKKNGLDFYAKSTVSNRRIKSDRNFCAYEIYPDTFCGIQKICFQI